MSEKNEAVGVTAVRGLHNVGDAVSGFTLVSAVVVSLVAVSSGGGVDVSAVVFSSPLEPQETVTNNSMQKMAGVIRFMGC